MKGLLVLIVVLAAHVAFIWLGLDGTLDQWNADGNINPILGVAMVFYMMYGAPFVVAGCVWGIIAKFGVMVIRPVAKWLFA